MLYKHGVLIDQKTASFSSAWYKNGKAYKISRYKSKKVIEQEEEMRQKEATLRFEQSKARYIYDESDL